MTVDRGFFFCLALSDDSPKAYVFGTMIRDKDEVQTRREMGCLVVYAANRRRHAGLQSELTEACRGQDFDFALRGDLQPD